MATYLPLSLLQKSDARSLERDTQPLLDDLQQRVTDGLAQAKQVLTPTIPLPEPFKPLVMPSWDETVKSLGLESTPQQAPASDMAANTPKPFALPSFEDTLRAIGLGGEPEPQAAATSSDIPQHAASGTPAAMPTGQGGEIDNSSREAFIRSAYPYALRAADGDANLAQQLVATAISENGKVGSGRSLGEMGFNVGGIQGVEGPAGSFTAMDAGRPRQFAAYHDVSEGFRAVRDLVSGGRYANAAAAYRQHGDIDRYWGDVNRAGYSETPDWQDRIGSIRRNQVAPVVAQAPTPPTARPAGGPPAAMPEQASGQLTPDQAALDDPDKWALCGPVAAVAMARSRGGTWSVAAAKDYAARNGLWNPERGMGGLETEAQLLRGMGYAATATGLDWQKAAQDAATGNPVTLSTTFVPGGHYVVLERFDAKTGKFYVGGLGNTLKKTTGMSPWMSPAELEALGGIQGALHFDNPASPTPGVAAAPTAGSPTPAGASLAPPAAAQASPPAAPPAGAPPVRDDWRQAPPSELDAVRRQGGSGQGLSLKQGALNQPSDAPLPGEETQYVEGEPVIPIGPDWRLPPEQPEPLRVERNIVPYIDPGAGNRNRPVPGRDIEWRGPEWPTPPIAPDDPSYVDPVLYRQPLSQQPELPAGEQPGTTAPIINPDGSVTTERSITVTEPELNGGRPTNIPTVWSGRVVSDDEAIDHAINSGIAWPSFDSILEATRAAEQRSRDLGAGRATSVGGALMPRQPLGAGTPVRDRWADETPSQIPINPPNVSPESANPPTSGVGPSQATVEEEGGYQSQQQPTLTIAGATSGPAPTPPGYTRVEAPRTTVEMPLADRQEEPDVPQIAEQSMGMPSLPDLKPVWDAAGAVVGYVQGAADQAYQALEPVRRAAAGLDGPPGYGQVQSPGPGEPDYVSQGGSVIRALQTPIRPPERPAMPAPIDVRTATPEQRAAYDQQASRAGIQADVAAIPYQAAEAARSSVDDAARSFADALRAGEEGRSLAATGNALLSAVQVAGLPWSVPAGLIDQMIPEANILGAGPGVMVGMNDLVRLGVSGVNALKRGVGAVRDPSRILSQAARTVDEGIESVTGAPRQRGGVRAVSGDVIGPDYGPSASGYEPPVVSEQRALPSAQRALPPAATPPVASFGAVPEPRRGRVPSEQELRSEFGTRIEETPDAVRGDESIRRVRAARGEEPSPPDTQVPPNFDQQPLVRDDAPRAGSISLNATPGVSSSASIIGDVANSLGGGVAGAGAGAALPADTPEERRRNALVGAGVGMVAGPVAGRVLPRTEGALATFGFGGRPANEAASAAPNPIMQRMARQMAGQYTPSGVTNRRSLAERWAQAWTDDRAGIRTFQEAVSQAIGRPLTAGESVAELTRVNSASAASQRLNEGLKPALQGVGPDEDYLAQYVVHRHNVDVAREMGQRAYDAATAAGASPQQASSRAMAVANRRTFSGDLGLADTVQQLQDIEQRVTSLPGGAERWQAIQDGATAVWDFNRQTFERKRDAGIISADLYTDLTTKYPHYVRTDIADYFDKGSGGPAPAGRRIGLSDIGIQKLSAEGTAKERVNPLLSTIDQTYSAEAAIARNNAGKAFEELLRLDPAWQSTFKEVVPSQGVNRGNPATTVPSSYTLKNGEQYLRVWDGGQARTYVIPPEYAALVSPQTGRIFGDNGGAKLLQDAMNVYKSLITSKNPAFSLFVSPLRDAGDYAIREGAISATKGGPVGFAQGAVHAVGAMGDYVRAVPAVFAGILEGTYKGDLARMMREGAGQISRPGRDQGELRNALRDLQRTGGLQVRDVRDLARLVGNVLTLGAGPIGERLEQIPRLAAARRAARRGAEPLGQVMAFRDATVDFQRAGEWSRVVNAVVPFFNVAVQGGAQTVRTARQNPAAFMGAVAATVGTATLAAEAWNNSDDQRKADYDDVPDHLKRTGIVVMLPGVEGQSERGDRLPNYAWIPTGQYGALVQTAKEAARGYVEGRPGPDLSSPKGWAQLGAEVAGIFSPIRGDSAGSVLSSVVPPGLSTGVELAANKDLFRGSTIATDRRDEQASALSQGSASVFNAVTGQETRPSQWEYLYRDLGGYGATLGLEASNLLAEKAGMRQPKAEDRPIQDTPVAGGLVNRVVRDAGGQRLEEATEDVTRVPESIRPILQEAGVRREEVLAVPSRWQGATLTREEQTAWQQSTNTYLEEELFAAHEKTAWDKPERREQLVRDAISRAREKGAKDALGDVGSSERRERIQREQDRKAR